jgi:hypothetical protein
MAWNAGTKALFHSIHYLAQLVVAAEVDRGSTLRRAGVPDQVEALDLDVGWLVHVQLTQLLDVLFLLSLEK